MGWVSMGWIGAVVMAYLIGSLPSAYIAGRLLKGRDIREEGDRNPGAGNAYRTIGPKAGLAVGVMDVGKGAIAVLVAMGITGGTGGGMVAGVAVVVGHNWPIFLQLRGGRGAACTVGVFIALIPIPAIPLGLTSLMFLPTIKSATIALGIIMIPMAFLAWITGASLSLVVYCVGLPLMVGLRHYLTSRKLHPRGENQAGERALPQG